MTRDLEGGRFGRRCGSAPKTRLKKAVPESGHGRTIGVPDEKLMLVIATIRATTT